MMKIDCTPHPNQKGLFSIVLDDDMQFLAHQSIFGKTLDLPRECNSLEDFLAFFKPLEFSCAKRYALRRLSIRSLHSVELFNQLKERFVSLETIESLIQNFQQLGFLNDQQWIEGYIRYLKRKNFGPKAIELKLKAKGIRDPNLPDYLNFYFEEGLQKLQVAEHLKKKFHRLNLANFKEKGKIISYFLRKGFSFNIIKEALEEMTPNESF